MAKTTFSVKRSRVKEAMWIGPLLVYPIYPNVSLSVYHLCGIILVHHLSFNCFRSEIFTRFELVNVW